MEFYLNFTAPSTSQSLKIKELSFKQLRVLNKFLHNKNNISINNCLEKILEENIIDYNKKMNLNLQDKFCIFLLLRLASISPEIEIKKGNFTKKTSLEPFYTQISTLKLKTLPDIEDNGIKIKMNLPKQFYYNDIFCSFSDAIDTIQIKQNQLVETNELSQSEKQNLFDSLPASILEKIYNYKQLIETEFKAITLNIDNENTIEFSPFNASLFEVLKMLYFSDLKSLYDIQYMIVSKAHYNPEYADTNTLLENIILINNYSDEMSKTTDETKKALDINKPPSK
jgi:hypothetical protein